MDFEGLTREEIVAVMQAASAALAAIDQEEAQAQEALADPDAVRADIALMREWRANVQGVMDTPNGEIKANPQQAIMVLARAQMRTMGATIRTLQLASRVFDPLEGE